MSVKERPILFSGPMVRAILDGRKTQTRRVIKLKTGETFDEHALSGAIQEWRPVYDDVAGKVVAKRPVLIKCPFGIPGDRLYIRETFALGWDYGGSDPVVFYRATGDGYIGSEKRPVSDVMSGKFGLTDGTSACSAPDKLKWKPSIHMPRWASRIHLEITNVRVERLHHINEKDCRAEGYPMDRDERSNGSQIDPWLWFRGLWVEINGPGSWFENPWVWVVEFKRIDP